MQLEVPSRIVDDSDSKPSNFNYWLRYKSNSNDDFKLRIQFWSNFNQFLIKFAQFGLTLTNFLLKDWRSWLKAQKSQLKDQKKLTLTISD